MTRSLFNNNEFKFGLFVSVNTDAPVTGSDGSSSSGSTDGTQPADNSTSGNNSSDQANTNPQDSSSQSQSSSQTGSANDSSSSSSSMDWNSLSSETGSTSATPEAPETLDIEDVKEQAYNPANEAEVAEKMDLYDKIAERIANANSLREMQQIQQEADPILLEPPEAAIPEPTEEEEQKLTEKEKQQAKEERQAQRGTLEHISVEYQKKKLARYKQLKQTATTREEKAEIKKEIKALKRWLRSNAKENQLNKAKSNDSYATTDQQSEEQFTMSQLKKLMKTKEQGSTFTKMQDKAKTKKDPLPASEKFKYAKKEKGFEPMSEKKLTEAEKKLYKEGLVKKFKTAGEMQKDIDKARFKKTQVDATKKGQQAEKDAKAENEGKLQKPGTNTLAKSLELIAIAKAKAEKAKELTKEKIAQIKEKAARDADVIVSGGSLMAPPQGTTERSALATLHETKHGVQERRQYQRRRTEHSAQLTYDGRGYRVDQGADGLVDISAQVEARRGQAPETTDGLATSGAEQGTVGPASYQQQVHQQVNTQYRYNQMMGAQPVGGDFDLQFISDSALAFAQNRPSNRIKSVDQALDQGDSVYAATAQTTQQEIIT